MFLAKTSLVAFPRRDANTPTPTTKCQQLSARRPRGCDRRSGRPIRICRACLWNPAWGPRAQQKSASSCALRRARRHLADVCKYLLLFARRTKLLVAHRLGAACGGDPFVGKHTGARQRGTQSPQRRAPRGHPGGASRGRAPARGATVSEAEAAVLHGLSQQLASAQGAQCRRLCGGQYNGPAAINTARSRRLREPHER